MVLLVLIKTQSQTNNSLDSCQCPGPVDAEIEKITDEMTEVDQHGWMLVKPIMDRKFNTCGGSLPEIGQEWKLTEDGFATFKFKVVDARNDMFLLNHYKNEFPGILARRIGGPMLTLKVYDFEPGQIMRKLEMGCGGRLIHKRLYNPCARVADVLGLAKEDPLVEKFFSKYDWADKEILSGFGEVIPQVLPLYDVWRADFYFEAQSMAHAFCSCQKCPKASGS